MIEPPETQPDSLAAEVDLKIAGTQVRLGLTVPTAPVRAGALLPVFRSLAEAIEADVASDLEKQGKRISCRAGCGGCCRQLVPVTQVEARHLAELVGGFPEPRLSTVLARFAEAIRRLDEAECSTPCGTPSGSRRSRGKRWGSPTSPWGSPARSSSQSRARSTRIGPWPAANSW